MNWIDLVSKAAIDAKNIKEGNKLGILTPEIYSRVYLRLMAIMLRTLDVPIEITENEVRHIQSIEYNNQDVFYCRKEINKGIRCDKQCRACEQQVFNSL